MRWDHRCVSIDNVALHCQEPSVPASVCAVHSWLLPDATPGLSFSFVIFIKWQCLHPGGNQSSIAISDLRKAVEAVYLVTRRWQNMAKLSFGGNSLSLAGNWPGRHSHFFPNQVSVILKYSA